MRVRVRVRVSGKGLVWIEVRIRDGLGVGVGWLMVRLGAMPTETTFQHERWSNHRKITERGGEGDT